MGERAAELRSVAAHILVTLDGMDEIVRLAPEIVRPLRVETPTTASLLAAGALLHGFYNEIEKVFEHIARSFDGFRPEGDEWHSRLLREMRIEIAGIRPAVIPIPLARRLKEYLGFRHVFRHLYVLDLDTDKTLRLLDELDEVWGDSRTALERFARSLREIADALDVPAR